MKRATKEFAGGRRTWAALGVLFFASIFLLTILYTLPGETLFSPLRSSLARHGIDFACEDARFVFPFGLQCRNAVIGTRGGGTVTLEPAAAAWEWTGLLSGCRSIWRRSLPGVGGRRTSPLVSNPGKCGCACRGSARTTFPPSFPLRRGPSLIDFAELLWKRNSAGEVSDR